MSIFNSLGSNYDFNYVYKSLLSFGGNFTDLEKLLEEKYGGKAVLVYKGREAIELALKTSNLPKGSFVAINGFTCFAVYEAIKKVGLNVEYLDIEKGDLNFSAETLQRKLNENPKIRVVIIQNTLGYPCQIEEISKICQENEITLIEDLAHSIGARYENGQEAGMKGNFVALSFSQDKMVDGVSGGTLIVKNARVVKNDFDPVSWKQQIIDKLYPMFTFLIRKTYSFELGKIIHFILKKLNLLSNPMDNGADNRIYKLSNWYTNLIKKQFEKLAENLHHRKTISYIYAKLINPKILSRTMVKQISQSSNLRFPVFVNNRESLVKFLAQHEIFISDTWYDAPIAPKKYLQLTDYRGQCPNSEIASDEIVNLPTHINIDEKSAQNLSLLINKWLKLQ